MANFDRSVVVTADHIAECLAESSDFVLELEVLQHARRYGWQAQHSGTYEDPTTGKARQFDIRAFNHHRRGPLTFVFAIECKAIQSHPLVILQTPRLAEEADHTVIVAKPPDRPYANGVDHLNCRIVDVFPSLRYPADVFVGRSTTRVGVEVSPRSGEEKAVSVRDSDVYEKWAQAISSGADFVDGLARSTVTREQAFVVVPAVVVPDGMLWIADYHASDATEKPRPVEAARLFVGHEHELQPGMSHNFSHLHFYTLTGIRNELREIGNRQSDEAWTTAFPHDQFGPRPFGWTVT